MPSRVEDDQSSDGVTGAGCGAAINVVGGNGQHPGGVRRDNEGVSSLVAADRFSLQMGGNASEGYDARDWRRSALPGTGSQ